MPNNRANVQLAFLAFVPNLAFAHGEDVLLFPLGTLVAVAAILLASFARRAQLGVRVFAGAVAIAASIPFWFVPSNVIPPALRYTGWGNFVVGFLPSLAVGCLVLWLFRRRRAVHNGA
jgi:hypothetical protein